jgi:Family of unknown function (DUF6262)
MRMSTAAGPRPRTAAALAARRRATEAAVQRVHEARTRLRREKAQINVAAVARRADVSRTFLYNNPEARAAIAAAIARAQGHRSRVLTERDDEREATWRERALNAEEALRTPFGSGGDHLPGRARSGVRSRRSPAIITRALWRSCFRGSDAQAGWWAPWMTCSTHSPLSCLVAAMRRFHALIVAIETKSAASCGSL